MSQGWLLAQRAFFVRDLVRGYCEVYRILVQQKERFEHDGSVSYATLRDLLGESMRKGIFWRLKDTGHHLFRNGRHSGMPAGEDNDLSDNAACCVDIWALASFGRPHEGPVQLPVEALIDWCIGYAFHECAKLKEDAFQSQHYANRLAQLGRHEAITASLYEPLSALAAQTAESAARELERILHVLRHGLFLLTRYLTREGQNSHLARWLFCEEKLVRQVFGPRYDELLMALYEDRPDQLYILTAQDFLETGRRDAARDALLVAQQRGLLCAEARALLQQLQTACATEKDSTHHPEALSTAEAAQSAAQAQVRHP